jgi:hypothetical protein
MGAQRAMEGRRMDYYRSRRNRRVPPNQRRTIPEAIYRRLVHARRAYLRRGRVVAMASDFGGHIRSGDLQQCFERWYLLRSEFPGGFWSNCSLAEVPQMAISTAMNQRPNKSLEPTPRLGVVRSHFLRAKHSGILRGVAHL